MYHMKNASIRDLRYRFSRIEGLLRQGEEIEITKRKRPIARLIPVQPKKKSKPPDFLQRLKRIYGQRKLKVRGAELLSRERSRE